MSRTTKPWRLPLATVNHEPAPWVFRWLARLVHVVMSVLTRRHWAGRDHIPASGGAVVVANHISNIDVLVLGQYIVWAGRWPRFLGKAELWRVPVVGWLARRCEQIPVLRNSDRAKDSLVHARQALEQGRLVAMYPEGTITGDPEGWPMAGRTGAVRIALETGAPVIPIGQIGAELLLGGREIHWRRLFGARRPVHVLAGLPVDLDGFRDRDLDRDTLAQATVVVMDALTALVEELRGQSAPVERWDDRQGRRVPQDRGPIDLG